MNNELAGYFLYNEEYKEWEETHAGTPNSVPLYTHPVKCNKCNDTEWVCENHPNQEAHKCIHCGGAGMPCECTHPANPYQSITDTKIEPTVVSCTHPAKEITDEEIIELFESCGYPNTMTGIKKFARAILRKAQEK